MENIPSRAVQSTSDIIWFGGDGIKNNNRFNVQRLYIEFWIWCVHPVSSMQSISIHLHKFAFLLFCHSNAAIALKRETQYVMQCQ